MIQRLLSVTYFQMPKKEVPFKSLSHVFVTHLQQRSYGAEEQHLEERSVGWMLSRKKAFKGLLQIKTQMNMILQQ